MTLLVLNRRRILDDLPRWFPGSREELVVLTDRAVLPGAGADGRDRRFRQLEAVDDYESPELEPRIEELGRRHGVRRILTTAEFDLPRAARVRQRLGLPGQSAAGADAYSDKRVMKTIARDAGIPVAPMGQVTTPAELAAFITGHGYPAVVKRPVGGSAIGQSVLDGPAALEEFTAGWPRLGTARVPMLAEAWVEGPTFHVDGLMHRGKVLQCRPSAYLNTQWETMRHARPSVSGMLPAQHPLYRPLVERTAEVVAALPPPPGLHPFHAEFFHTADRGVVLCEIACRAGGMGIVEAYARSFDTSLYEAGLKGQAGRSQEVAVGPLRRRHGFGWLPPRRGVLRRLPDHCPLPGVVRYDISGVTGRRYHGPRSVSHTVAQVVFTLSGPDLLGALREFEAWWNRAARWEPEDDGR